MENQKHISFKKMLIEKFEPVQQNLEFDHLSIAKLLKIVQILVLAEFLQNSFCQNIIEVCY